ncbi:MAG: RNA polymerase subunit sigma [Bacteroidetes bacterium 4572_77]|nr:MAG: RNA polymerase subunit sigma [Bacteroidetes bacterium 4572_77]
MEWNEADIIKACKKQNRQAQMALFHKYRKQYHGLCRRYVNNTEIAEELLMDAFVVIFKTIQSHNGKYLESWMRSIVIHKAIDYYRKHKNDPVFHEIETVLIRKESQEQNNNVEAEDLLKLLHTLPPGYRMVFNLHSIEGYQHKEIAEKLGVSINTSKTQLHKARQKLKAMLKRGGYYGE